MADDDDVNVGLFLSHFDVFLTVQKERKSEEGRGCGGMKEREIKRAFADNYTLSASKNFIDIDFLMIN